MSCMFTTGRCYVYIRWYKMFCVHMPLEGFYPPLVGSKPQGQPQPSPNWLMVVHGSSELNPRADRWAVEEYLLLEVDQGLVQKLQGEICGENQTRDIFREEMCVSTHLNWVKWSFWRGQRSHAFRLTYLVIFARNIDTYSYTTCFVVWSGVFAESSYGIVFVGYWILVFVSCTYVTM